MLVRPLAVIFVLACLNAAPALAIEQPAPSGLYLIVPFGEPGDTDPVLNQATQQFSVDLSEREIRSQVAPPIDAIEAVGSASRLCDEYGASGLLVPQLRFEQSKERNLTGFIPVVGGVVSSSGAFDRSPIRARLKVFLIDCTGNVRWKAFTTANKVHKGTNVNAGLTEIANQTLAEAVDQFASRPKRAAALP
jgi:hypothetical protein